MTEIVSKIKAKTDTDRSSYRQIMKATSIFGGVQVLQIIIGIIRTKFVAVLLGPAGMGIAGLLDSTIGMIAQLSNLGLRISAVKDLSAAHGNGDLERTAKVTSVIHRLVWFTGLLGGLITLVLAPFLSQLTFGNRSYTWAFMWLSVTLVFNQLSIGNSVILQGMRQIPYLAKAGMIGSCLGLVTTVPLYYLLGIKGIVPGMILMAIFSWAIHQYFTRKVSIQHIDISLNEVVREGKGMIKLGFLISLNSMITLGVSYAVRIFISRTDGVEDVGLFNAGFAIVNSYVGLIFTAMSTDYYPRLSAVAHSNEKSTLLINQQAEVALLIISPILMVFLVFINWVVIVLYSEKFIAVSDMILYAGMGIFFKAASWSIAYIFLSKGNSQLFFWIELITNLYVLGLNILGYYYWGLTGLGVSFFLSYFLYFIQVFFVAREKYEFGFTQAFYKIFGLQIALASFCFAVVKLLGSPYSYIIGSLLIAVSAFYAYKELDKRLDMKAIIVSIKYRFK